MEDFQVFLFSYNDQMFHFQYNPLYKRARDIRIVQAERFVMPDKKISYAQIKQLRRGRV